MKRIICLTICVFLVFSVCVYTPAFAEQPTDITVADFSKKSVAEGCGFPISDVYKKSGDFTMRWGYDDIKKDIQCDIPGFVSLSDGYLEMYIYSSAETDMPFALSLIADNPQTEVMDMYTSNASVSWKGWKKTAFKLGGSSSGFKSVGTPLEYSAITSVKISSLSDSDGTCLYFDKLIFKTQKSEDSEVVSTTKSPVKKLMLADYTDQSLVSSLGFEYSLEHSKDNEGALKYAAPNLSKKIVVQCTSDWSDYDTINIEAYSENKNNNYITMYIDQDDPAKSGGDYYSSKITCKWEGSWKNIQYEYNPEKNTSLELAIVRSPLGWDNVKGFSFDPTYGGNTVASDTVLYIKRIYLTKERTAYADNYSSDSDYIPPYHTYAIEHDIASMIKEKYEGRKSHPRIACTQEQLDRNIELIKSGKNTFLLNTYKDVLNLADIALKTPDSEYGTPDGLRLVKTEREMIRPLTVAYLVSGDKRYLERCVHAMEVAASWPDWNSARHFLCTAEMAYSFALAYDLLYYDLTESEKRMIRNAIVTHALEPAMHSWRGYIAPASLANNWQEVCGGGIGMAALAIADEPGYEGYCTEMVSQTLTTMPRGLELYAPEGMFREGNAYWQYASRFFFSYDKALYTSCGTDFGASQSAGLSNTAYTQIASSGPDGVFNYSDGGIAAERSRIAQMFWMAKLYDDKNIGTYAATGLTSGTYLDILMYDESVVSDEDWRSVMGLDYHFRGQHDDLVYIRSSWWSDEGTWLALKGGSNLASHGDLDMGQFVLDMQDTRWFVDLGSGYYEAEGYWGVGFHGTRWRHYRKRAEAHNTIVLDPDEWEDQVESGNGVITDFKTSKTGAYGFLDMSEGYDEADKVIRGFAVTNNRSDVVIQDSITTRKPTEVYQFYTTQKNIEIDKDNPRVAYLSSVDGKMIKAEITSPADAEWGTMGAVPLPTSPDPAENHLRGYSGDGFSKMFVHLKDAENPVISVYISNVFSEEDKNETHEYIPFERWDEYLDENIPTVNSISIGGIPLESFSPNSTEYSVSIGRVEDVSAEADGNITVTCTQADKVGDVALIKATDNLTGKSTVYSVAFKGAYVEINADMYQKYKIVGAAASDEPEANNIAPNTYDGDYNTRWSAENEASIVWELSDVSELDRILLSFWKGDERYTSFGISVSADGSTWEKVYDGKSSGATTSLESFDFGKTVNAKYIRYEGRGASTSTWNSILEAAFPVPMTEFADISDHWAKEDINDMRLLGLVEGVSKTEFAPDSTLTVAQFIKMIMSVGGFETSEYKGEFKDVSQSDWFAPYIQTAYDKEIIPEEMIIDGCINPNVDITREQMCAISVKWYTRYIKDYKVASTVRFADSDDISSYAKDYVGKALTMHVMRGTDSDHFSPKGASTRAQAAVVLKRLYLLQKQS